VDSLFALTLPGTMVINPTESSNFTFHQIVVVSSATLFTISRKVDFPSLSGARSNETCVNLTHAFKVLRRRCWSARMMNA